MVIAWELGTSTIYSCFYKKIRDNLFVCFGLHSLHLFYLKITWEISSKSCQTSNRRTTKFIITSVSFMWEKVILFFSLLAIISTMWCTGEVLVKTVTSCRNLSYLQEMLSVRLLELTDKCADSSNNPSLFRPTEKRTKLCILTNCHVFFFVWKIQQLLAFQTAMF